MRCQESGHGYQHIDEKAVVLNWIVIYVELTLTNLLILQITSLKMQLNRYCG